jgi:hypothetical protein
MTSLKLLQKDVCEHLVNIDIIIATESRRYHLDLQAFRSAPLSDISNLPVILPADSWTHHNSALSTYIEDYRSQGLIVGHDCVKVALLAGTALALDSAEFQSLQTETKEHIQTFFNIFRQ